jgi:hypothetical protein
MARSNLWSEAEQASTLPSHGYQLAHPRNKAPVAPESPSMGQAATAKSGSTPDHAILQMSITKDELRTAPEFSAPR